MVKTTRMPGTTIQAGWLLCAALLTLPPTCAEAGVDVYLTLGEAPAAVFAEADSFERQDIQVTDELRDSMKQWLGRVKPSVWEPFYISFTAKRQGEIIGYAVVCEEIGKHRPITFIVAVTPDGAVKDVAVMMYREAIGQEVRHRRFLKQFEGRGVHDAILPYRDIKNISGATLSVRALTRGVRKALAFIHAAYLEKVPMGQGEP